MSIYLFVCLCVSFNSLSLSFVLFKISLASIFYFSKMFPIRSRLFSTSLSLSLFATYSSHHSHNSLFSHRTGNKKNQIFYQSSVLNLKPTQFLSFSLSLFLSLSFPISLFLINTHKYSLSTSSLYLFLSFNLPIRSFFLSLFLINTHTKIHYLPLD